MFGLRITIYFMALSGFIASCTTTSMISIQTGQTLQSIDGDFGTVFSGNYWLHVPESYQEGQKLPLMIFLHGAGERGDDMSKVKIHGPPKIVETQKDFPFLVVSPQVPEKERWDSSYLMKLIDDVEEKYPVDKDRIYLTGLSMGGFGTWDLASKYAERFAAIAPICGGGDVNLACNLKEMPTWAFHGAKDAVVTLDKSQEMVDAINECGGKAKLTIYPEAGHDSWTESYNNQDLYDWFLEHSLADRR